MIHVALAAAVLRVLACTALCTVALCSCNMAALLVFGLEAWHRIWQRVELSLILHQSKFKATCDKGHVYVVIWRGRIFLSFA